MSPVKSFRLSELADAIGGEVEGDPNTEILGISSLSAATQQEITFITRESFIPELRATDAAAVICNDKLSEHFKGPKIIGENPHLLYAKCTELFKSRPSSQAGIAKLTFIDETASVASSAVIENFVSISKNAVIEENVVLMPGVFIGHNVVVKSGTVIHSNASVYDSVEIGHDCIIHSGVVLGSDGLGFAKDNGAWVKIQHLGGVVIGNNVELGSNTTIDRGSVGDTILDDNVKIDNLVHLAHNVHIGSGTAIAANSAVAGSTKVGKNCTLAGCTALVDNIELVDEVHITAKSLITKSIKESGFYSSGTPFMKNTEWKKNAVGFKRLYKLLKN